MNNFTILIMITLIFVNIFKTSIDNNGGTNCSGRKCKS